MTKSSQMVHHSFVSTEAEDELIRKKMQLLGIKKKSVFFRTMILKGLALKLDLTEIREALRLLKNLTNNVNQIAKHLHEHGSIYETEIDEIKQRIDDIWVVFRQILDKLSYPVG